MIVLVSYTNGIVKHRLKHLLTRKTNTRLYRLQAITTSCYIVAI